MQDCQRSVLHHLLDPELGEDDSIHTVGRDLLLDLGHDGFAKANLCVQFRQFGNGEVTTQVGHGRFQIGFVFLCF